MRRWLRLYPAAWRERYGDEMEALLADIPARRVARVDLARGALDAHLHPVGPLLWPVLAASIGGIAWTFGAAVALGQPRPPEWPGYLEETLPVMLAAGSALVLAAVGASTRVGDVDSRLVRFGRQLVAVGGAAWLILISLAILRVAYGWPIAVASSITAAGAVLIGLSLLRVDDRPVAELLLASGLALVVPLPWAHVAFGVSWVAVAVTEIRSPRPPAGGRWGSAG